MTQKTRAKWLIEAAMDGKPFSKVSWYIKLGDAVTATSSTKVATV